MAPQNPPEICHFFEVMIFNKPKNLVNCKRYDNNYPGYDIIGVHTVLVGERFASVGEELMNHVTKHPNVCFCVIEVLKD